MGYLPAVRRSVQFDREFGAAGSQVARPQAAAELAHDVRGDHQPEAQALAGRLGGDEGLEQARQDAASMPGPVSRTDDRHALAAVAVARTLDAADFAQPPSRRWRCRAG